MRFKIVPPAGAPSGIPTQPMPQGSAAPVGGEIEVPTRTVAAGILSAGTVSALLTTLISTALPVLLARPKDQFDRALTRDRFRVELLEQAMKSPDPADRASSLRILVATGLLDDETHELRALIGDTTRPLTRVPQWGARTTPASDTSKKRDSAAARQDTSSTGIKPAK